MLHYTPIRTWKGGVKEVAVSWWNPTYSSRPLKITLSSVELIYVFCLCMCICERWRERQKAHTFFFLLNDIVSWVTQHVFDSGVRVTPSVFTMMGSVLLCDALLYALIRTAQKE